MNQQCYDLIYKLSLRATTPIALFDVVISMSFSCLGGASHLMIGHDQCGGWARLGSIMSQFYGFHMGFGD